MLLATPSTTAACEGKSFDCVVIGATPGGISCAVRAAREGLSVLLVQHDRHIGGILASGLGQYDSVYGGSRAPIFDAYTAALGDYYRRTFGEKSTQYRDARYSQEHYPVSRFEGSAAEREFNRLVSRETNISLLLNHDPTVVKRDGATLQSLTLRETNGTATINVSAKVFVDATYEGDLAALAKVPYRIGREGRDEFGEPHAGKVFTNIKQTEAALVRDDGINLRKYNYEQGALDPASTYAADKNVQAYNYRLVLTTDASNRRLIEKPPGYNRDDYVHFNRKGLGGATMNGKSNMNAALVPGANADYPGADWTARQTIIDRHLNFALGLVYFMQNDESVSADARKKNSAFGLPLDEFADNQNVPYVMYVREARRIVGRYVFREQDCELAPGLNRAPLHADSISFTDWPMDSHVCTNETKPKYPYDGKLILENESRPAQVPYASLLPQGVDNLLVPVCLSATHVAWGAVRLEPTYLQIGESTGFAVAMAVHDNIAPAALDPDRLLRALVEHGVMISFFNELSAEAKMPAMPAAQYFATKGFFADYNARLGEPLKHSTAAVWNEAARLLKDGRLDANATALKVAVAEKDASENESVSRGDALMKLYAELANTKRVK